MLLPKNEQTQELEFISGYVRNKDNDPTPVNKNLPDNTTQTNQQKTFFFDLERTVVQVSVGYKPIHISNNDYVLIAGRRINNKFHLLAYKNLTNEDKGNISSVAYKFALREAMLWKIAPSCISLFCFYQIYKNSLDIDGIISLVLFLLFPCVSLIIVLMSYQRGCLLEKEANALNNLQNQVEKMETPETKLYKLQQDALIYLKELFNQNATAMHKAINSNKLKDVLRMSQLELLETENYLEGKGFIGWFDDQGSVYLTPSGISCLENLLSQNNSQTPSPNITNNIVTASVIGVGIQNGSNNTTTVTQSWGTSLSEVEKLIEKLKESFKELPGEKRVEALDLVVGLEKEVQITQPSKTRIKTFLDALTNFVTDTAQKTIIEILKNQMGISA